MDIISTSQEVSFSNGKVAPWNEVVEDDGDTVKITVSYSLAGGVTSPEKAVIERFCQTIALAK